MNNANNTTTNDDAVETFKEARHGMPRLVIPAARPQAIAATHCRCVNYWHALYAAHGNFSECSTVGLSAVQS